MKIPRLLATALASAGAWAEAPKPQAFFIKVGAQYVWLRYNENSPEASEFEPWWSQKPSEVMLKRISENSFYAKTRSGVVGFNEAYLSHGPELKEAALTVDPDSKLVHLDVYFCQVSGKISQHMKDNEACDPVELFLSPFDRETGQISLDQDLSVEPALYVPADHIPHTLFAADTDLGAPRPILTSRDGTLFIMSYDLFRPERFYYENGFFFTKYPSQRFVGTEKNMLVHASSSSPFEFTLLQTDPTVHGVLFACETTNPGTRRISHRGGPGCRSFKLTYSPFDRNGNTATSYSALPESEVPNTDESPLVFFAKVDSTYHPLSIAPKTQGVNVLSYGLSTPPTEIKLESTIAVPINTIITEPVGFDEGWFAVSSSIRHQRLSPVFDDNGMLKGQDLFSCEIRGLGYFPIARTSQYGHACSKVDVYLGRFKRETGEYIKFNPHQPEGGDNNGSHGSGNGGTPGPVDDPESSDRNAPTPEKKDQDKDESQSPSKGTGTDEQVSPGGETGQVSHPEAPKADDGPERGRVPKMNDAPDRGHEQADGDNKGNEPTEDDKPEKGHEPKQKIPEEEHEPKQKNPDEGHASTDNADKDQEPNAKDEPEKGHEPKQKIPEEEHEPKQKNPDEGHASTDNADKDQEPNAKDEPEKGHEPKQNSPEEEHEPKQKNPDKELEPKQKNSDKELEPKQKRPEEEHAPTNNGDMGKGPKEKDKPEKGHVPTEGEDKEPDQKSPVPEKDDSQVRKSPVSKPDHKDESGAQSKVVPATDALLNGPGASKGSRSRSSSSKINGMVHGASDVSSTSQGSNVTFSDTRMHRTYNSTHFSVSNTSEFRFHDIFHLKNRTRVTNIRNGICPECVDMKIADASAQHARPIREAASPTTFCDVCNAATKVVWNTRTDYTTYCPQKTTLTISKCEDVCSQTMVTVSAPTMFTCPGVCIIPETVAERVTRSGVEAATAVQVAVETDARGVINAPNRVSPLSVEERKSSESTKDHKSSKASSEQPIKFEQGNRTKEKEFGSQKHEISSEKEVGYRKHDISSEKEVGSRKHDISSDEQKVGSNEENRKGKEHGSEKRPSIGSSGKDNASKEQSNVASKPKAARLTGDSARSSKTRPVVPDETSTSTLTNTVTRPGVTPYDNGASRMPVGAFLFVLASLLM